MQGVIEVLRAGASAAKARVVIFDFDGTLSVIRSGWMEVMLPLCVEQLTGLDPAESPVEIEAVVEEFVWRLTGKETIFQMAALAEAVRARGGQPLEPLEYKRMYLDRLWKKIGGRVEGLRSGAIDPANYLVPGAREFLEALHAQGLTLYLASGTDEANVQEEAELLRIAGYFNGRIFGAHDDGHGFSKAQLVKRILSDTTEGESGVAPDELLVFGDGFVEIEEVKRVGGTAVGLATAEPECRTIDAWKRERLRQAGADFIIPNYLAFDDLCASLFKNAVTCS